MKNGIKLIVFGDSISFGQHISPHLTWVGKMSSFLGEHFPDGEVLLQCEAVNGRTTRMALETMPNEVQKQNPDIVLIQFGLNDCNRWETDKGLPRVSKGAFSENLKEMILRCQHFGAKKIFVNTNHPTNRSCKTTEFSDITYDDGNAEYSDVIRNSIEMLNNPCVELIDIELCFRELFLNERTSASDYLLPFPDMLHLNEVGHVVYFEILKEYFLSAINELNGLKLDG